MTDAKYRGRHRSRRGAGLSPRIVGTGLVLPTTATLAVVSVTGGAPMALTSTTLAAGASTVDDATTDRAELTQDKSTDSTLLARGVQDRVARDSERVRVDTVAQENAKRAATEASLAANDVPVQVSLVGAPGSKLPASAASLKGTNLGSKAWVNPLGGNYSLSSNYGWRWGRLHSGQDMACPTGTPVRSISSGVVTFSGWAGNLGYKVEILHWDGTVSWYGHNSKLRVSEGQRVEPGQLIALAGSTGNSTGPHVHLEIHPNGGNAVPPKRWLAARGVNI